MARNTHSRHLPSHTAALNGTPLLGLRRLLQRLSETLFDQGFVQKTNPLLRSDIEKGRPKTSGTPGPNSRWGWQFPDGGLLYIDSLFADCFVMETQQSAQDV